MLKTITLLLSFLTASCVSDASDSLEESQSCGLYGKTFCTELVGSSAVITVGPDFFLYDFYLDNKSFLTIYEGDHPELLGSEQFNNKLVGKTAVKYKAYEQEEILNQYYLREDGGRLKYLHVMTHVKQSEKEKRFSDIILTSLRFCYRSGNSISCD